METTVTTPANDWWEKQKQIQRLEGKMCVKCENIIETNRIEWAKKHNLTPPKYCWICSRKNNHVWKLKSNNAYGGE